MLGYRQQSPRLGADRHRWRRLWPVVVAMMMMTSPVLPYHGIMLSRFIGQDLLSPALLAAEALITPANTKHSTSQACTTKPSDVLGGSELQITSLSMYVSVPVHVHVLVRTELPPAQEAGPR
jgi:hypothetical protein